MITNTFYEDSTHDITLTVCNNDVSIMHQHDNIIGLLFVYDEYVEVERCDS